MERRLAVVRYTNFVTSDGGNIVGCEVNANAPYISTFYKTIASGMPMENMEAWVLNEAKGYNETTGKTLDNVGTNDATLVKSYCAEFNGSSDYIQTPVTFASIGYFRCYFKVNVNNVNQSFAGTQNASLGRNLYFGVNSTGQIFARVGTSGAVVGGTSISIDTVYKFEITWGSGVYTVKIDDVVDSIINNFAYTGSPETVVDIPIGKLKSTVGDYNFLNGCIWNVENDNFEYPLQGSTYDISGNGNHGTNNGSDITAVQDNYHYNVLNGFGAGAEKLIDGDMESAGVGAWTAGHSATLTKEPSNPHSGLQCLKIDYNGVDWAQAYQAVLTVGKIYRVIGWARSDGSSLPEVYDGGVLWQGTTSIGWQKFDVIFQAQYANIIFQNGSAGNSYVEFDDITVKEAFIPRLADDSGFADTVTEEHLAGYWNNMPESYFRFPSGLTDDIMDKSDVTIWSADVRSSAHYDSGNPRDWHSAELTLDFIATNINPTYKNRIFVCDNQAQYIDPPTKSGDYYVYSPNSNNAIRGQNLLIYSVSQTDPNLIRIVRYCIGLGSNGITY